MGKMGKMGDFSNLLLNIQKTMLWKVRHNKMKALKHIWQQPFVFATGLAALIHSTWALGTLFSGEAPQVNWQSWEWYEWIVPALLIAFALDVGQISTSSQIREHGLTKARAFTFVIFAVATYYLQWLYMAVHMPLLDISSGVTGMHTAIAENLRNWAIWLIPALLPISTVSYTFSGNPHYEHAPQIEPDYDITVDTPDFDQQPLPFNGIEEMYKLPEPVEQSPLAEIVTNGSDLGHISTCDTCGWKSSPKDNEANASRALAMHKRSCDVDNE